MGPNGALYEDDVFPAFGMTVREFGRRFAYIFEHSVCSTVVDEDRDLLNAARRYLLQHKEER